MQLPQPRFERTLVSQGIQASHFGVRHKATEAAKNSTYLEDEAELMSLYGDPECLMRQEHAKCYHTIPVKEK